MAMHNYNNNNIRKIRSDVADSLKVTKGQKAPTISEHDYKGLAAFDASLYENQHRHGSRKQVLQSIDKPVVEIKTEKVSEHVPYAIVQGVELSPEQLINYHNSQYK